MASDMTNPAAVRPAGGVLGPFPDQDGDPENTPQGHMAQAGATVRVELDLPADLLLPLIESLKAAHLDALRQGLVGPGAKP